MTALVHNFAALLTPHPDNNECLTRWIDQTQAQDLPHLRAVTRGLELDRPAVNAALTHAFHGQGRDLADRGRVAVRVLPVDAGRQRP